MKKSPPDSLLHFDTRALHEGVDADKKQGSRNMPVHQTVCYQFEDAEHGGDLFALKREGFIYSRLTNPTVAALEQKLTALEDGSGATAAASGLAAQFLALFPLMSAGDQFLASRKIYGGSGSQFQYSFKKFGWECVFLPPEDPDAFRKAITPKTKAIFVESVSNPGGVVADLDALAAIAEEAEIPLIVDNTIASPALFNPFKHGAALITHSLTKYISGQSTSMGGAVVEAGTFDWSRNDKFPSLSQPDESYHGLNFYETFKDKTITMHAHAVGLRDMGAALSPANAFHILLGTETLGLRMKKHVENAHKVARFLENHDAVDWVSYAGLKSHPSYQLAQKYMPNGTGAVFSFGMKNKDAGFYLPQYCTLFHNMAHIGDAGSLIIHPASTTHRQLSEADKSKADCGPEVVRLSIGLEDAGDLIHDLETAIAAALKAA